MVTVTEEGLISGRGNSTEASLAQHLKNLQSASKDLIPVEYRKKKRLT